MSGMVNVIFRIAGAISGISCTACAIWLIMSEESHNGSNQNLAAFMISICALIVIGALSFFLVLYGPFSLNKETMSSIICLPAMLFIVGLIINKQMK